MASSYHHIQHCGSAFQAQEDRGAGGNFGRGSGVVERCSISSVSYNAGRTSECLRRACGIQHWRCCGGFSSSRSRPRPMSAVVVRAAGSKQKKKAKVEKKKSSSSGGDLKQWKFDELMLVWDDVFMKACENSGVATAIYELSRNGFAQYGLGCVLIEESVNTRPWGSASGFTFKSRYSSSASPELPSYSSAQWKAEYVPKEFILDPSKAPTSSDTPYAPSGNGVVRVVDQGKLISVLRGMDRTRLMGLLSEPGSQELADVGGRDAGGEEPCDPTKDELVIMLVVLVDGQPAVGADVLRALPTTEDGVSDGGTLWTLKLRDDLPR